MINNVLNSLLGFILLSLMTSFNLNAATIGLDTGSPKIEAGFSTIDFFDLVTDGDLSTFGAVVDFTDGVSPFGFTEISFGVGYDLVKPTIGASGGFDVFDENGLFLGGELKAVGFSENEVEFQFENLSGAAASDFDSSVLMVISFFDALGANPFDAFVDGTAYDASISIANVKPVSEPAMMPLIMLAFLGMTIINRRK